MLDAIEKEQDPNRKRLLQAAYDKQYVKMAPGTQVTVDTGKAQTKEQEELRKRGVARYDKVSEAADVAEKNLYNLDLLDNMEVGQGALEPIKQGIAKWGEAFGVDTKKLANVPAGQAYTAIAGSVVLDVMASQKGPQTESDMKQIRSTVANLGKDPAANKFLNNAARAVSKRAIEKRDFYDNYLDVNDTLKGAQKAWNDHIRDVPLISKGLKNKRTGLPVFYHDFEEQFKADNPTATRDDIVKVFNQMSQVAYDERRK